MAQIIQIRRDTAANWTAANPILAQGEPALEIDTKKEKIGDGVTAWNSLPYKANGSGTSSAYTGTVIPLNNPLVTYCNMGEASSEAEYTLGDIVNGGKARLLVNRAAIPNIIGATNIKGDEFQANTPIYIEVENSGGRIEYWVKQIYESPFEDITGLPFGKIVDSSTNPSTDYIGTPCIIQTTTGRIIMSHDIYGSSASKVGWGTILVSDDMGQTFTKTLEVASLFWGNLFEYDGKIFIIYTSNFTLGGAYDEGDIAMRYSTDDGDTWSSEIILFSDDGTFKGYLTHATNVIMKDGYMAMGVAKANTTTTFASYIQVGVLYGNLTDLTNPSNYSLSSFQSLNTSLYPIKIGTTASATKRPSGAAAAKGHLEPCLVEHASGIRMHCRLEQTPNSGYSVYYDVTWNASNPPASVISTTPNYHEMFGGQLKFQITWDETSSKFWTVVNWNKVKYFTDNRYELFLAYSTNAIDWTVCQKVGGWEYSSAWETEITNKGTQYASFIIKNNDIYFAARTTSDSGANQHDADLLTLTKISNFRSAIPQTFVDGSLILDENSIRLENGSGIGVIFDQSKYQNAAYMLTANNANKVSWVSGLNFTGSQYMRVPHNEYLDPATNGISVFVVIENLQNTGGLRILSKSDGSPVSTVDINAKDWSFNAQGMTIGNCYTDGYTDISIGNNYILASSYDKTTNTIWNYRNGVNRGLPPTLSGGAWSTDHINKTDSYAGRTTAEMYIGKRNVGTSLNFTSKIKALHIIPSYMTPTEMVAYQNALNAIYSIY